MAGLTVLGEVLGSIALVFGVTILVTGVVRLAQVPFALVHEVRHRRLPDDAPIEAGSIFDAPPSVTVVVPAYNEEVVLENCLRSIMASDYPDFQVICVDDGSSDNTFAIAQRLAAELPGLTAVRQENAGKGAALNHGIGLSTGDVLILVDSDGVFGARTLTEMVRGFTDEQVGAVCGDDRPVNLDRVQTRFLALVSHVGTGLMRRALDVLHALPVVSGNTGAFRRDVLDQTGLLRTDTVGEDLELTWRIYRAGYRVAFRPTALVYAESPSTLRGLWRQRVRWARGLLQTVGHHGDMVGNPRYGFFGIYLAINYLTQVLVPFLQVLAIIVMVVIALLGTRENVPLGLWQLILFLGLPISVALLLLALWLDRAPEDLRHLWTLPLWPVYSALMTAVMLRAVWLEVSHAENRWNKLDRTGTVSIPPGGAGS
ncbi:MAG: glycosyltransferase family 2 protein [Propionicimonas sp.]|uniref:glycosyltransferase n=1 Tax=Propionicimonas sp. TaxID=1955623 RepID=UPI003D0F7F14